MIFSILKLILRDQISQGVYYISNGFGEEIKIELKAEKSFFFHPHLFLFTLSLFRMSISSLFSIFLLFHARNFIHTKQFVVNFLILIKLFFAFFFVLLFIHVTKNSSEFSATTELLICFLFLSIESFSCEFFFLESHDLWRDISQWLTHRKWMIDKFYLLCSNNTISLQG